MLLTLIRSLLQSKPFSCAQVQDQSMNHTYAYLRDDRMIKLRMVSSQHFINEARGAKASPLRSHRRATVAQITEKQCWSHRRPVRVPMMTPVHHRKHLQCSHEHQSWTVEQWKNAVLDLDSVLLGNLESKHVKSPCFQRCSDYSQYGQYSQSH